MLNPLKRFVSVSSISYHDAANEGENVLVDMQNAWQNIEVLLSQMFFAPSSSNQRLRPEVCKKIKQKDKFSFPSYTSSDLLVNFSQSNYFVHRFVQTRLPENKKGRENSFPTSLRVVQFLISLNCSLFLTYRW